MAGNFTSGEDEVISGINVTPLVDVVLVLLVIFMITAPVLYQSAIKVQLPKAKTGQEADKSPLSFSITKDGSLLWGKDPVTWDDLNQRLGKLSANLTEQTAMISADEQTPHGTVIKLMDALRTAGLTRFGLSVEAPATSR